MSTVTEAAEALEAALTTVEGLRTYRDPGANVAPPAVVLGPPLLRWEGFRAGPTSATFTVFLVTAADDRALERLWQWVPVVAEALDEVTDAATSTATPGTFPAGGADLPCYQLQAEVSL